MEYNQVIPGVACFVEHWVTPLSALVVRTVYSQFPSIFQLERWLAQTVRWTYTGRLRTDHPRHYDPTLLRISCPHFGDWIAVASGGCDIKMSCFLRW